MLLSDQERKRFIEYLEVEVYSAEGIVTQMEKLPGVPKQLIEQNQRLAAACKVLIKQLGSGERG